MAFDYSKTGLPHNDRWNMAGAMCFDWLNQNMPMFRGEGIDHFMRDQPVAAAQRLMAHVPDCSEELVTMALLGPARSSILPHLLDPNVSGFVNNVFGPRVLTLMLGSIDLAHVQNDAAAREDLERLFMVEAISSMADQMIGRQRKDAHHHTRWDMLTGFEVAYAPIKGKNAGLDALFQDALAKSKASLKALDAPKPQGPK